MTDISSIVVHAVIILFGLFGVGVSVAFVDTLLFIGSIITFCVAGYSLLAILKRIHSVYVSTHV